MTRFKICGLRDVDHALVAAEVGADFLGFGFVDGVRRHLTLEQAYPVIQAFRDRWGDDGPKLVGLFADQPIAFVNRVVSECGLDYAQLCGAEGVSYWNQVSVPVIRQIRVRDEGERSAVIEQVILLAGRAVNHGQTPLLDTYRPGAQGGTGHTFDWSIAAEVSKQFKALLAGGLTPDNVGEAIAVARPWCVDVSSGVETGGTKDSAKIRAFATAVRYADRPSIESPDQDAHLT